MLGLSTNDLGAEGARALVPSLLHLTALQTLQLSNNALGDEGVKVLGVCLQHLTALQLICLVITSELWRARLWGRHCSTWRPLKGLICQGTILTRV
mmetsp:Transcript_55309/g.135452  ORF Transcript_55309/g.135452 Transcript_55309/m.135452 type:complete len:96 (+) Transcript_55309:256-543(+)